MTPAVGKQKSSRLLGWQVAEDPWRRGGALFLCPCHCRDQPNEKLPGLAASPGTCRLAGHRADWPLGSLHGDPAPASTLTGFFFLAPDAGALPPLLLHVTPLPASPLPGGLPAAALTPWVGTPAPGPGRRVSSFPAAFPGSPDPWPSLPFHPKSLGAPRPPPLAAPLPPWGWPPAPLGRGHGGLTCSSASCLPNCLPSAAEPRNSKGTKGSEGRAVSPSGTTLHSRCREPGGVISHCHNYRLKGLGP